MRPVDAGNVATLPNWSANVQKLLGAHLIHDLQATRNGHLSHHPERAS